MKRPCVFPLAVLLLATLLCNSSLRGEVHFQTVAVTGQQVPGATNGVIFSGFDRGINASINRQGLIAFGAFLQGPRVNADNNRGVCVGFRGFKFLASRSGDTNLDGSIIYYTDGAMFDDGGNLLLRYEMPESALTPLSTRRPQKTAMDCAAEVERLENAIDEAGKDAGYAEFTEFDPNGEALDKLAKEVRDKIRKRSELLKKQTDNGQNTAFYYFREPLAKELFQLDSKRRTLQSVLNIRIPADANSSQVSASQYVVFRAAFDTNQTFQTGNALGEFGIVAGFATNLFTLARIGMPAPGTTNQFFSFDDDLALGKDGSVIFSGVTDGQPQSESGIWYGVPGAIKPVMLADTPAPDSLLGAGLNWGQYGQDLSANSRGEVAFAASLVESKPTANPPRGGNVIVAGTPDALHVVAQSGQPAPGIVNAVFHRFDVGIGTMALNAQGQVAFIATFSANGPDFGLWLGSTNGPARLIARTGGHAPGTPDGVVFSAFDEFAPPWSGFYLNERGQIAFGGLVGGPGITNTNNYGIWLSEPDGSVNLVARDGNLFDLGNGTSVVLSAVRFIDSRDRKVSGGDDGKITPLNAQGDLIFSATWEQKPTRPLFQLFGEGIFVAHNGLVLTGEKAGNDIRIKFPTLAGKHYRIEYAMSQPATSWSVLAASVSGTGAQVTATDAGAAALPKRFYRVVRVD